MKYHLIIAAILLVNTLFGQDKSKGPVAAVDKSDYTEFKAPQKNYCGIVEIGSGIHKGAGENIIPLLSVHGFSGYRLSQIKAIGVGYGLDLGFNTTSKNIGVIMVPVTFAMRVNFTRKRVAPFFNLDLGYNLHITGNFVKNGTVIAPAFGVKGWLNNKLALSFRTGFSWYTEFPLAFFYSIPIMVGVEF